MKVNVNQCNSSQEVSVLATTQTLFCSFSNLISHFKALFQAKLFSCYKMFKGKQFKNYIKASKYIKYILSIEIIVKDACYK